MGEWANSEMDKTLESNAEEIPLRDTRTAGLINRSDVDKEALDSLWKSWRIGGNRTLKLEFKNNLLLLNDYLMARYRWTFPIQEWLEQIWELKKLGYLEGGISVYSLDTESATPLLAGSESGSIFSIIAPREPRDIFPKEVGLKFNERGVNEDLYSEADAECMKAIFKDPEREKEFYAWSTSD